MPALLNYRNTIISAVVCLDLVLFLRLVLISASFPWLCLKVYFCCSVELEQISTVWKVIKNWDDWRRNKGFNCVPSAAQVGFYHLDHQLLTLVCNAGLLRALALCISYEKAGLMSVPHNMAKAGFGCPGCHMRQQTSSSADPHIMWSRDKFHASGACVEAPWLDALLMSAWAVAPECNSELLAQRQKVSVQPMSDSVSTPTDDLSPR